MSTQLRLQRALTEIRTLSRTDSLTGLANRRAMQERLSLEVARCERNKAAVSLLMVDIDYFKQFNDHYGHNAGDQALKAVADELGLVATRPSDLASRGSVALAGKGRAESVVGVGSDCQAVELLCRWRE